MDDSGNEFAEQPTQCKDAQFMATSEGNRVPTICGTNHAEHSKRPKPTLKPRTVGHVPLIDLCYCYHRKIRSQGLKATGKADLLWGLLLEEDFVYRALLNCGISCRI